MTRAEFDTWIEQHYEELIGVARRRVKTLDAAQDVVQSAVAGMLASAALPLVGQSGEMGVWPWAAGFIRGTATHARRAEQRNQALRREQKILGRAGSSHGRGGTK